MPMFASTTFTLILPLVPSWPGGECVVARR